MLRLNAQIHNVQLRNVMFEGRNHLVAPVILLTEGVHAGSAGPMYYPASVLESTAQFWNGMPLPVHHPECGGVPISANSPEVIQSKSVGRLWNVRYETEPKPRLKGEIWIDEVKAQQVSPEVLSMLRTNQPLEVSTGLFSVDELISGVWNNENYNGVVKDMRPDHLALLPGSKGACSWEDGCGVRANQAQEEKIVSDKGMINNFIAKVKSLLSNDLSLDLKEKAIRNAIYAMDSPTKDHAVQDIFDTYVIYMEGPGRQSPAATFSKMYKRAYSIDDQGNVTLGSDVLEVKKVVKYEPVVNAEPEGNTGPETKVDLAKKAAELFANFNPNHGPDGRFSSGPGGAGGGAGGVVHVPSFYLKSSVVTKSVEIDDEGASLSATLSYGSIKSGPNKGKYQAYIKSHDMGGEFISRKLYTSDSELRKEINFDKISYDKMIESFKRM